MIYNSRLVLLILLISLFIIFVKTESTNTPFSITANSGCTTLNQYSYHKLVDGDIGNIWYANPCVYEGYNDSYHVSFQTSRLVEIYGFKITLSYDAVQYKGNNPKTWVFKAKEKDSDAWTDIDERTVDLINGVQNNGNYTYTVSKPGNYSFFTFIVTQIQGQKGNPVSLAELWLLEIESCPDNEVAPQIGCKCGTYKKVCTEGQICQDDQCLSSCPNNDTAPENGCYCDSAVNICNKGQFCNSNVCLSSCPNNEIAPENGCYCDSATNICKEGQFCDSNVCKTLEINPIASISIFIALILSLLLLLSLSHIF